MPTPTNPFTFRLSACLSSVTTLVALLSLRWSSAQIRHYEATNSFRCDYDVLIVTMYLHIVLYWKSIPTLSPQIDLTITLSTVTLLITPLRPVSPRAPETENPAAAAAAVSAVSLRPLRQRLPTVRRPRVRAPLPEPPASVTTHWASPQRGERPLPPLAPLMALTPQPRPYTCSGVVPASASIPATASDGCCESSRRTSACVSVCRGSDVRCVALR